MDWKRASIGIGVAIVAGALGVAFRRRERLVEGVRRIRDRYDQTAKGIIDSIR